MRTIVRGAGGGVRLVLLIVGVVVGLRVLGAVLGLLAPLLFLIIGVGLLLWLSNGARSRLLVWQRRHRARYGLLQGEGLAPLDRAQLAFWQGLGTVLKLFERDKTH